MSRESDDDAQSIPLSVLDRLFDDDPDLDRDVEESIGQYLDRVRNGIRRDMEALLNSRRRFLNWPAHLEDLATSVINFGVVDFTNDNLTNPRICEELRLSVAEAVRRLEPRILGTEVTLEVLPVDANRALVFKIAGYIRVEQQLEPLQFEASMEPIERVLIVETHT